MQVVCVCVIYMDVSHPCVPVCHMCVYHAWYVGVCTRACGFGTTLGYLVPGGAVKMSPTGPNSSALIGATVKYAKSLGRLPGLVVRDSTAGPGGNSWSL